MNYTQAKQAVFCHGTQPSGYFGDRAKIGFALIGHTIITVADCGCFNTGLPDCQDEQAALWLLKHHPNARHITITGGEKE